MDSGLIGALLTLAACGDGEPTDTLVRTVSTATVAPAVSPTATAVPAATAAATATPPHPTAARPLAPTAAAAPTATPAPVPTAAPTAALAPKATIAPTPTPAPTHTRTPEPTATSTPEPTPTPVLLRAFDEFGFNLNLGRGADVETAGSPSAEQGAVSFAYGEVNTVLTWTPQGDTSALALVDATYDLIQSNQQDLVFETLSDGEIIVDGELGVFLGFKATDASGSVSGGLIGSWACQVSNTGFTLTLTGADTAVVQVRFDELMDNFKCTS